jgi:hypothetical protein
LGHKSGNHQPGRFYKYWIFNLEIIMTYPSDFTNPSDVFGDLVDLAAYPVTGIQHQSDWVFFVTFSPDMPNVNPGTPLVYAHPAANGNYEIVKVISCNRAMGYISVERAQEGTRQLAYGANGYLVQEPTAGTYTALKNLLLITEKHAGRMGTSLPGTCSPGMFYFRTDTGAFYACFSSNVWTRLDQVDHGALTGLTNANAHTIYKTLAQAIAWHDALTKKHLTNPLTHDHSDSGAGTGKPVRKLKSGAVAQRGSVKNAGDVFVASDQKTFFISTDGTTWKAYSTVPRGTVLMFDTACPSGWDRVTTMDDRFPRGAGSGVWSGFGTGGAATHQHDITTLISHTHTVQAATSATNSGGSHSHSMSIWGGSGGSSVPYNNSPATGSISSGSGGSHTHSVTIPTVTTGSFGVASPKTSVVDGQPSYLKFIFCRKA